MDISNQSLGHVTAGGAAYGIGEPDGQIVSLGDGGVANLAFSKPIANGEGPDFAVFENAFTDNYLELGFVEVSSDGVHFFRFESISLTSDNSQVGSFGTLDATKILNLAGKYTVNYGVPFDIDELPDDDLLNKDSIIYVKVIDVVGSIQDEYASFDSEGYKVNDPWPTPFESGGFDLDAVGVIHQGSMDIIEMPHDYKVNVFPNPFTEQITLTITGFNSIAKVQIRDSFGNIKMVCEISGKTISLNLNELPSGVYFLMVSFEKHQSIQKLIKK